MRTKWLINCMSKIANFHDNALLKTAYKLFWQTEEGMTACINYYTVGNRSVNLLSALIFL